MALERLDDPQSLTDSMTFVGFPFCMSENPCISSCSTHFRVTRLAERGLDAGPLLLAEDSQPKCASEQTMYIE